MKRTNLTSIWSRVLTWAAGLFAAASLALAQHPIPEAERWATITHPGNAPFTIVDPRPGFPTRYLGGVDYEYQISRTEVTGAEWFEFVQAYAPYAQPTDVADSTFTSTFVGTDFQGEYFLGAGNANRGVEVGFRFAARYVNWLHNDKRPDQAAFENGVYDTSTFGFVPHPNGGFTDQQTHHPDARYWIPTEAEWLKAAHFDPDRHGPGVPGYWLYSNSSDVAPRFGSPANGGETSTGGRFSFLLPEVATYRDVRSPWGLWDTSGGFSEWTGSVDEDPLIPELSHGPFVRGSSWRDSYLPALEEGLDRVDGNLSTGSPLSSRFAFRLARAVPGAGSVSVLCCAALFATRRRRQSDDTHLPHCSLRAHAHPPADAR